MPVEGNIYYNTASQKILRYVDGSYITEGAVNENVDSVRPDPFGGFVLIFDSAFDMTLDAMSPIISGAAQDSDGNNITWTCTSLTYGSKGKDKDIIKIIGSSPEFNVSSTLDLTDSTSTMISLSSSNYIKVTGKISSPTQIPKFNYYDSSYLFDGDVDKRSLSMILQYNVDAVYVIETTSDKILSLVGIGSPDVKFKKSSLTEYDADAQGFSFKDSGRLMFIAGNTTDDVAKYTLPAKFDTINFDSVADQTFTVNSRLDYSNGKAINSSIQTDLDFNDSGNRMLLADKAHNKIYQYNLATPFDLNSAEYISHYHESDGIPMGTTPYQRTNMRTATNFDNVYDPTNTANPERALIFGGYGGSFGNVWGEAYKTHMSNDGLHYYIMNGEKIFEHSLSQPFNMHTLNKTPRELSLRHTFTHNQKRFDGTTYAVGTRPRIQMLGRFRWRSVTRTTYQYFGLTDDFGNNAQFTQHFQLSLNPSNLRTNGGYRLGGYLDWTAGYKFGVVNGVFVVTERNYSGPRWVYYIHTTFPQGFTFSNDGTKLFVIWGLAYDRGPIIQYELSTAWDISTATISTSILHSLGKGAPATDNVVNPKIEGAWGIQLNNDGTALFIWDNHSDKVYRYDLSTPYDISTASNDAGVMKDWTATSSVSVANVSPNMNHFIFNNNGSKFYLSNSTVTRQFTMSTNFDITTATFEVEYQNLNLSDGSGFTMPSPENRVILTEGSKKISSYSLTASAAANNDSADLGSAVHTYENKFLDLTGIIPSNSLTGAVIADKGSTLYLSENSTNTISKLTLSDSNEIYSASFDSAFSTGMNLVEGMGLTHDETKMYIVGKNTLFPEMRVQEFVLNNSPGNFKTTSWNSDRFNLSGNYNQSPKDIKFKDSGNEFYVLGKKDGGTGKSIDTYTTRNNFSVKPI